MTAFRSCGTRHPTRPIGPGLLAALLGLALLTGCQELALPPEEGAQEATPTAAASNTTAPPAAPSAATPDPYAATPTSPAGATPTGAPPAAGGYPPQTAAPAASGQLVEAKAGVGARGRGYGGGVITEPLRQRFLIEQRLVFQIQIPQAMKLYKAVNEHGPQSHEEFMREIIEANSIQLPELPAGERYLFDPATQQLMVQRPLRPNEVPPGSPPGGTPPPSTVPPAGGSGP